jgi:phosphonopyruvate decarboxylase
MLDTNLFVEELIKKRYSHACVVPCSFAQYLINAIINHPKIEYIPCASEAVACSIATGLQLGKQKPIVIIQSSGMTNMGSCLTSLVKPYQITFAILSSWRTYTEGESEIQHKHLATFLPDLIASYGYKSMILNTKNIITAIEQIEQSSQTDTILLLKKETFSQVDLVKYKIQNYPLRSKYLIKLNQLYKNKDVIFIGTTGNTSREMYSFMPDTQNFYMVGNMGGALSLGTGFALTGKKVIVLGGDAEFVMHLGGLTTVGRYENLDITYILFDNEQNKSTGGQDTYQHHINYIQLAKASNFQVQTESIYDVAILEASLRSITTPAPHFLHIKCGLDTTTARPPLDIVLKKEF